MIRSAQSFGCYYLPALKLGAQSRRPCNRGNSWRRTDCKAVVGRWGGLGSRAGFLSVSWGLDSPPLHIYFFDFARFTGAFLGAGEGVLQQPPCGLHRKELASALSSL